MSRVREERGASVTEVIVASGLMAIIMTAVLFAVTVAQRHEVSVERIVRAVNGGRVAIDRIVKEARRADDLSQTGQDQVRVWYDRDGDRVEDPSEVSVFEIASTGTLIHQRAGRTETLVDGLVAGSALRVSPVNTGMLLSIVLSIDPDPARPPGPTVLRTEVLARNG